MSKKEKNGSVSEDFDCRESNSVRGEGRKTLKLDA